MIFLRIFDAKEEEYEWEAGYASPLPAGLRWREWAADDEGMTGDELLDFVNNRLFPELKALATDADVDPRGRIVGEVFTDSYNYMKSGTLMRQVINRINRIDFHSAQERHLFNDLYEKILRDLQSAGNAVRPDTSCLYRSQAVGATISVWSMPVRRIRSTIP